MKSLTTTIFAVMMLAVGCKPSAPSAPSSAATSETPPQVSGSMCERIGGIIDSEGTCRCENGVAAFKLLGQSCSQLLARQSASCTAQGGQVLYDDGRCRCFPDYDVLPAGTRCAAAYPRVVAGEQVETAPEDPRGACVVLERSSGKVQPACFDQVDLEGCERSFQVAYNQLKPEQYEMVFYPQKDCAAAKAAHASPQQR